ncbi:MAG: hypothetical protein LBF66_03485 [Holosporales bacterium]|nr:hypothetical protein [Holosporales bacterium]
MPIRQLFRFIICTATCGLAVQYEAEPSDALALIGFPTDAPAVPTIWGALKSRYEQATLEQKALFGEWDSRSNKTIFGRVNNLMYLLSINNALPPTFNARLKDDADSFFNVANSEGFDPGSWFDQADTGFGKLHELSSLLFPVDFNPVLGCSPHIEAAHSLMSKVLPYADVSIIDKSVSLANEVITEAQTHGSARMAILDNSIFKLFELLYPLYLDVAIGRADTTQGEATFAPLFAKLRHLESVGAIDEATNAAVSDRLLQLKTFHPKSIDQFLDYFSLVTGSTSLGSCLDARLIGTPYNAESSSENTFFVVFNDIARKCRSKEEKFRQLADTWGDPSNTPRNATVFGKIAEAVAALPPSLISTFKKKWIGQYPLEHGISLFSNFTEIGELLHAHQDMLQECTIDHMIQLIGIAGDTKPSSLFGAISSVNGNSDFEEFARSVGFDKRADEYNGNGDDPGSCLFFINTLKKLIFSEKFQCDSSRCPNLHKTTINQIIANDGAGELQSLIQEDCAWRLTQMILPQIHGLRSIIADKGVELLSYIGNPDNENYNELSVSSKIRRLLKNLTTKTFALDWKQIYSLLFFGPNSLQSKIYEIHTHAQHGSFENLIGNALSRDYSLFGLLNQCLHKFEVEPLLDALCPHYDADNPEEIKGPLIRNLASVCSKFVDVPDDYKTITHIIGDAYKPHQLQATTLINIIGFFHETLACASSIFSFDELEHYAGLIFGNGSTTGLLAQSNALLECSATDSVTDITGRMLGINDSDTMCNTCLQMYKDIFTFVRNIVIDSNVTSMVATEYDKDSSFYKFLAEYQSQAEFLDLFLNTVLSESIKLNIVDVIRQIFELEYSYHPTVSDFSFLTAQHSEPSNTYFLLKNIAADSSEAKLRHVNEEITKLIHTLIVTPYIHLLVRDTHAMEGGGGRDGHYASEGMLLPTYNSAINRLSYIAKRLPPLPLVPQNLVGKITDSVDVDHIERLTVFGLLNEILQIISLPSFFSASVQSLGTKNPNVLSHWYFNLNRLIGSCYDNGSSTSSRTFFEILKQLVALLDSPNVESQQEVIKKTIGDENINRESSDRSLFSTLEAILRWLIAPYATFMLDYSATKDNAGTGLARVRDLFKSIGYQNVSSFQPLNRIGDPSTSSAFFARLGECINAFQRDAHLELLPISFFLAYSKALYAEIQEFALKMKTPLALGEVETFISNVDSFISKLLSLGPCDSCGHVVDFLHQMCERINEAAQSLAANSNEDLIAIFSNTSFGGAKDAVLALKQAVADLKQKIMSNESSTNSCIVQDSEEEFAAIYEKMGLVQSAIYSLGVAIPHASTMLPLNTMCQSLPDAISKLINSIDNLSTQMRIPLVKYVKYSAQNTKDFAEMVAAISEMFNDVTSIIRMQNCSGCRDSVLGTDKLTAALQRFANKLTQINTFMENSYASQLAYHLCQVAQVLKKTSAYVTGLPLVQGASQEIWQVVAASMSSTATSLQRVFTILNNYDHFQDIISVMNDLYEHMNEKLVGIAHVLGIDDLNALEHVDGGLEAYDAASMRVALDWVLDSLNQILQYWTNPDMSIPLADNWIIPLVESMHQSYLSINDTLSQDISYWADTYNLVDKIALIRTKLAQGICPAINDTLADLKSLCSHSFSEQFKALSYRLGEFDAIFMQLNPQQVLNLSANIEAFLSMWASNVLEIAHLVNEAARRGPTATDSCLHFSLFADINQLISALGEACTSASGILSFSVTVSPPTSLSAAIASMATNLQAGNTWWQNVLAATTPLVSCQHALSSTLMSLQSSYASIADGVTELAGYPMCVHESISFENIAQLIRARGEIIEQVLQRLNSELACRSHISQRLGAIEITICNICSKTADIIGSSGIGGIVHDSLVPELFQHLVDANHAMERLDTFLQEATEGACIAPAGVILEELRTSLDGIAQCIPGKASALELPSHEIIEIAQRIEAAVSSTSEQLLIESLSFAPESLGGDTVKEEVQRLHDHIFSVEQVISELSTSAEVLGALANTVNAVSPMFSSCFPEIKTLFPSVQRLSREMVNFSIFVQNIHEKMIDLHKQLEITEKDDIMTQQMHRDGKSQKEWLTHVEDDSKEISTLLAKERQVFGFRDFLVKTMTHPFGVYTDPA